jgi:FKBP-type peptidyl-prolyl cis-trans isomerase
MKPLPVVLGLLAIATAVPAWMPTRTDTAAAQVSETLGGDGVEPAQIAAVTIATRAADAAAGTIFQVKRTAGQWVIASNHNYPADANTRVSRLAGNLLGLRKEQVVGKDPNTHADFELLDPTATDGVPRAGYGKLVTLADATGREVVNLIIGKAVPIGDGQRYVRVKGENTIYTAKVNDSEVTTKFTDFVEASPFKIARDDIRAIAITDYSIDEVAGQIVTRNDTRFARASSTATWTSPQAPAAKRVSTSAIDGILGQITNQQLVSVRPFELGWLQARGFFASQQANILASPLALRVEIGSAPVALLGNEGRLDVTTKDGLRYSLLFGEVAVDDSADTQDRAAAPGNAVKAGENRYLAVFVTYDAALDEDAKAPPAESPKDGAAPTPKKISGKERAAKAQARYQQFFYVISDLSFKTLRPEVAKLFEDLPPEPMAGTTGKTNVQWLAENATQPGVTTTPSGLQYRIDAAGPADGPKPTAASRVKVHYRGTKVDGTEFDSSATSGGPVEFPLTSVVAGWTEGIPLLTVGTKATFWLPPALGYGGKDRSPPENIGPDQILIFEVELVEVLSDPAPAAVPLSEPEPAGAVPADAEPAPAAPTTP